jgi:hypothetical protein
MREARHQWPYKQGEAIALHDWITSGRGAHMLAAV